MATTPKPGYPIPGKPPPFVPPSYVPPKHVDPKPIPTPPHVDPKPLPPPKHVEPKPIQPPPKEEPKNYLDIRQKEWQAEQDRIAAERAKALQKVPGEQPTVIKGGGGGGGGGGPTSAQKAAAAAAAQAAAARAAQAARAKAEEDRRQREQERRDKLKAQWQEWSNKVNQVKNAVENYPKDFDPDIPDAGAFDFSVYGAVFHQMSSQTNSLCNGSFSKCRAEWDKVRNSLDSFEAEEIKFQAEGKIFDDLNTILNALCEEGIESWKSYWKELIAADAKLTSCIANSDCSDPEVQSAIRLCTTRATTWFKYIQTMINKVTAQVVLLNSQYAKMKAIFEGAVAILERAKNEVVAYLACCGDKSKAKIELPPTPPTPPDSSGGGGGGGGGNGGGSTDVSAASGAKSNSTNALQSLTGSN